MVAILCLFLRGLVLVSVGLVWQDCMYMAFGGLAFGELAFGGLAFGGLAFGGVTFEGLAFGGLAFRGLAFGGLAFGGLAFGEQTFGALALGDADFATVLPGFVTRDVVWVHTSSLVLSTMWCLPVVTADPEAVGIADSVGSALRGFPTCPLVTLAAVGDCFFTLVADLCTDLCVLASLVPVTPVP